MSKRFINGHDFYQMVSHGAERLDLFKEEINALNVFPVPDGDTGSNMNMTFASGMEWINRSLSVHLGETAKAFAEGLLMGARGNSGVILSQLFSGFANRIEQQSEVDVTEFANALNKGVQTAVQAVLNPVEGTILTVAREAAEAAIESLDGLDDFISIMDKVLQAARYSLERTPELLPVLKQAGVVDSGGAGLVRVYEGFISALRGEKLQDAQKSITNVPNTSKSIADAAPLDAAAQSILDPSEIEHFYDMEFFIRINPDLHESFDENALRSELSQIGDSILVIQSGMEVKVHVHSKSPGEVFNLAVRLGELHHIHVENMREQHRHLLNDQNEVKKVHKSFGILAVGTGDGIHALFSSLGVDEVISGGQTMNPSTEEILDGIKRVQAEHVFLLPNNSNVILTAKQAAENFEGQATVIPTHSVQEGVSAVLAFSQEAKVEENAAAMNEAVQHVKSGMVTFAVRDSEWNGLTIKVGDYLGLRKDEVVAAGDLLMSVCEELFEQMIDEEEDELITLYTGAESSEMETAEIKKWVENRYPEIEIEIVYGGQPLAYYWIAVE